SFWIEIVLVPLLSIIVAMGAVAEIKKEYLPVKKIIDPTLRNFGFILIVFALFSIFRDFKNFATIDNLRVFLLPPLLTFAYVPFLYAFALYMIYENLFIRLDIFIKEDKALAKLAKKKIFALCHANLGKIHRFAKESNPELIRLSNENDLKKIIRNFKSNYSL
ncbi:MAG: hypothetical protein ABIG42_08365, partial [bacterium]